MSSSGIGQSEKRKRSPSKSMPKCRVIMRFSKSKNLLEPSNKKRRRIERHWLRQEPLLLPNMRPEWWSETENWSKRKLSLWRYKWKSWRKRFLIMPSLNSERFKTRDLLSGGKKSSGLETKLEDRKKWKRGLPAVDQQKNQLRVMNGEEVVKDHKFQSTENQELSVILPKRAMREVLFKDRAPWDHRCHQERKKERRLSKEDFNDFRRASFSRREAPRGVGGDKPRGGGGLGGVREPKKEESGSSFFDVVTTPVLPEELAKEEEEVYQEEAMVVVSLETQPRSDLPSHNSLYLKIKKKIIDRIYRGLSWV